MLRSNRLGTTSFVLSLLLAAPLSAQDSKMAEQVTVTPEALDFGLLPQGPTTSLTFTMTRTGDAAAEVTQLVAEDLPVSFRAQTPTRLHVPIDAKTGVLSLDVPTTRKATFRALLRTSEVETGAQTGHVVVTFADGSALRLPVTADIREKTKRAPPPTPRPPAQVQQPVRDPNLPPPKLTAAKTEHDYGTLLIGESATHTFSFKNEGEGPLQLMSIRTQCNCTGRKLVTATETLDEEEISKRDKERNILTLAPGEEASLEVELETDKLSPTNPGRPLKKSITLVTDDPTQRSFQFIIQAELKAALSAEPARVRMPDVRRGEPLKQKVLLTSDMIEGYTVTSVEVPEHKGLRASFEEVEGGAQPKYALWIEVTSEAPKGRVAEAVIVHVDHPRVSTIQVPVYVNVLSQVDFIGNQERGITRLDFGSLDGKEDASVELKIVNRDPERPYHIKGVDLSARSGLEHFSHEIFEDEPGVRYRIKVTVSKDFPERFFSGKVRITSDHPDERIRLIDYRGWVVTEESQPGSTPIRNPTRPLRTPPKAEGTGGGR